MTSRLKEACSHRPFSNGTERQAWENVWCSSCTHDHDISHGTKGDGPGCDLLMAIELDEFPENWPEAWLPEPDDSFHLPSLTVCARYTPCQRDRCDGDPLAEIRANVVAHVTDYWRGAQDGER